jgi:hypothetical protein
MMVSILLLVLSLALPGEGPAPAATAAPPLADAPRDWDKPPPGAKADQALWQSAHDVNNELVIEQHVAARLTQGAKGSGYLERLPELGKSGALPQARADELAARLLKKWTANLDLVQRQWPVSKVRVCGYELLNLEGLMGARPGGEAQLADSRRDLVDCVGRANLVLGPLKKSNEELGAALAEIERELSSLPASPGTSARAKPD